MPFLRYIIISFTFLFFCFSAGARPVKTGPVPGWVSIIQTNPDAQPKEGTSGGFYYLTLDYQENIAEQTLYSHVAYKILTNEGVQQMSDISIDFDPAYQKVSIHQLVIRREGKVIDKLLAKDIKTIQRETNMDRFLYDGTLTAFVNIKDVRVGDVVEYAFSRQGYNPVFEGHFFDKTYFDYTFPYEKFYYRLLAPREKEIFIKYVNGEVKAKKSTLGNLTEYAWLLEQQDAIVYDDNTPGWYDPGRSLLVSDFKNWGEVARSVSRHYHMDKASRQKLKAKVDSQFKTTDLKKFIEDAILFVQDDIRYFGFESGLNSHKPHDPVKIFDQRFGDCKDKSFLLCSILRTREIEAYPMLVSTYMRDKITEELPSTGSFNHCVAQIRYEGKVINIDPTLNNQGGGLGQHYFPSYGKGLVLRDSVTGLSDLSVSGIGEIDEENIFDIEKVGKGADLYIKTIYTGHEANNQRSMFASGSIESIQKKYIDFYMNQYPDIQKTKTLEITDDRKRNEFTVEEHYKITGLWKNNTDKTGGLYTDFCASSMETYLNVKKSSQRKSPYSLTFPLTYHHTITVNLPEKWNISAGENKIENEYYSFQYKETYMTNEYTTYRCYKTFRDHVPASFIDTFTEDHQTMNKALSMQITYGAEQVSTFKLSWFSVMITFISVIVAGLISLWLYFRFDPYPAYAYYNGKNIGGWLVFVAIGLVFAPFRDLVTIFGSDTYFNENIWDKLASLEKWGIYWLLFFELVYASMYFVFSLLLILLFFKRRSSLPLLITIYMALSFFLNVTEAALGSYLPDLKEYGHAYSAYGEIVRDFVAVAIWVPYFNLSRRVKETFVKMLE